MRRVLILLGALALAALESGCTKTSCNDRDPDEVFVKHSEGIAIGNTFFTGPFEGPFLYFPPARTYWFDHELNSIPKPHWLVAFSERGNLAAAPGDMAINHRDPDDPPSSNRLGVLNNTCSDFYLWGWIERAVEDNAPEPTGEAGAAAE